MKQSTTVQQRKTNAQCLGAFVKSFLYFVFCFFKLQQLPMSVHGDAVTAEQGTTQNAIVSSSIAFVDRDHDQTAFGRLDVLDGAVFDFLTMWPNHQQAKTQHK